MEEKKTRELNLEEMDHVSGGMNDTEENRRDYTVRKCKFCGAKFTDIALLEEHLFSHHL